MKINLLELAQKVQDTYEEVECSFGPIKVYHVPHQLLWTYELDRSEPVMPMVSMKLATGDFQERPIKEGDTGYEQWIQDRKNYTDELNELQNGARFVEALKDVEYPDDMSIPPPMVEHRYNGHWPSNEILQKKIWLNYTILAKITDISIITDALALMSNPEVVTSQEVENIKKNSVSTSDNQPKQKPKQT